MDDRNAQVGWTEAQWNRVRQEVLRSWQSVRVAGSFLPTHGPLPPGTQVVPSELLNPDGTVDDTATSTVLEISLDVVLTRQQVMDDDLSSALLQFRRRATQVGQLEDWYIFNGQCPRGGPRPSAGRIADQIQARQARLAGIVRVDRGERVEMEAVAADEPYRPNVSYLNPDLTSVSGLEQPIAGVVPLRQKDHLLRRNPGALGLLEGAPEVEVNRLDQADDQLSLTRPRVQHLADPGLTEGIVRAITTLDQRGYVAPQVCVLGRGPFMAANRPLASGAIPRDRIEPLIGREILHASAIDILPVGLSMAGAPDWRDRGLLLSLAGDPVDIALVAEASPEFRQVDERGRYIFAVFERFALRIKDRNAIVSLAFS